MVTLGAPLDRIAPAEALLGLLRATAGHVNWLRESIMAMSMEDLGKREAAVILKLYDSEREQLRHVAEAAMRAGASAMEVRLEETRAQILIDVINRACIEAGVSSTQRAALGEGLRKVLADERNRLEPAAELVEAAARADAKLAELRERIAAEDEARIEQAAAKRLPADLAYPPEEWVPADDAA